MKQPDWTAAFVAKLLKIGADDNPRRGEQLAHLRRGLNDTSFALSRVGWLFDHIHDVRDEEAAILTAGLYAWAKGACRQKSGVSFAKAFGTADRDSREKRFLRLVDATPTDLPDLLRQCVARMVQGSPPPLDWGLLALDLLRWEQPDRKVQKKWARGFWSAAVVPAAAS